MMRKRLNPALSYLCLLYGIGTLPAYAQAHQEKPDMPYLPPVAGTVPAVSPAFRIQGPLFTSVQVNVDANGNNILNDAANEPSIGVNPIDASQMVIGWRQFDNISSSFRQAGVGYSVDGGASWSAAVIDPGVFRSDPVLATDASGKFYYNSLTVDGNEFSCNVYRSTGNGGWDDGPYAIGGDKQWMVIDTTQGPGRGNIYAHWSASYSACENINPGNFTRSSNGGESYEDCELVTPNVFWGTCAVGPDGTLYISSGNGGIARSLNAQVPNADIEWESGSFINWNGELPQSWNGQDPNPSGLKAQSWIAVNPAPGPLFNQTYVVQSVRAADESDPADVLFSRSDDGGLSFSAPIRINDDDIEAPNWQWFATMSVAPNGRIDVIWLDTRDNPGTVLSSLYYAYSTDGGETWSANERLSPAFDPHAGWPIQQKIGDYYHMVSDNAGAHLAWSATFSGGQDVYYGRILLPNSAVEAAPGASAHLVQVAPNPMGEQTQVQIESTEAQEITIRLYDQRGRMVRQHTSSIHGAYTFTWDGKDETGQSLPNGIYIGQLSTTQARAQYFKVALIR